MSSRRQLILVGLFLLGGFIAYSSILNSYFLSDDFAQVGKVLNGDYSVVWGQSQGGFFRPLFILSYIIDARTWGAHSMGFHFTNVAFHSLNAFLTFILATRLIAHLNLPARTGQAIASFAGALFLLHPSHTEAVSWISGRADLIATFFCLVSVIGYLNYLQSPRRLRLALALGFFALALLAKESAVCLPLIAGLLGLYVGRLRSVRQPRRDFLVSLALYFSVLLIFVLVRTWFIGSLVGGYGASQHLNFSPAWIRDRILEASVRSVLPVLPWQLSRFLFKPLQSPVFILFALGCAAGIAFAITYRRRLYDHTVRANQNKFLLTLVGLGLFSLLPVISLRLTLYQTLGERFLYLPTVFTCLLIAYLTAIMIRRRAVWLSLLFCLLAFYTVRLYQTNQTWREAAVLSSSIKAQLAATAGDRLLIVNAPDNLRGVPVFHNGLPEAMRYFQSGEQFKEVEVLAFQELESIDDAVEISRTPEVLMIDLLNQQKSFERVEPVACLRVTAETRTSLTVINKDCRTDAEWFVFRHGRMERLP